MPLLSMIDAILATPNDDHLEECFHEFRLMYGDEQQPRRTYFLPRGETIPRTIDYDGITYHEGQTSGPSRRVTWYEFPSPHEEQLPCDTF